MKLGKLNTNVLNNGLNTKPFSLQLERKSPTNINLNTASILSLKVKQRNRIFYLFFFGSYSAAHFTIHFSMFFEATSILRSFSGKIVFSLRELVVLVMH